MKFLILLIASILVITTDAFPTSGTKGYFTWPFPIYNVKSRQEYTSPFYGLPDHFFDHRTPFTYRYHFEFGEHGIPRIQLSIRGDYIGTVVTSGSVAIIASDGEKREVDTSFTYTRENNYASPLFDIPNLTREEIFKTGSKWYDAEKDSLNTQHVLTYSIRK